MTAAADQGIYVFEDFLHPEDCKSYIDYVLHPPADAGAFTDNGFFTNFKTIDPALADSFYRRLVALQGEDRGRPFLRANTCIMGAHYTEGGQFGLHTDTGLFYDRARREASRWTLLIYLNDDFKGGGTTFYTDAGEHIVTVTPKAGAAVVFDIQRWHQGEPIQGGEKYWIGCEIIGSLDGVGVA